MICIQAFKTYLKSRPNDCFLRTPTPPPMEVILQKENGFSQVSPNPLNICGQSYVLVGSTGLGGSDKFKAQPCRGIWSVNRVKAGVTS